MKNVVRVLAFAIIVISQPLAAFGFQGSGAGTADKNPVGADAPLNPEPPRENGEEILRRIDFRDGSSLQAILPASQLVWKNIAKDGKVTQRTIPTRQLKQVTLVREPSTARVASIRNLLSQLGSEDYHLRKKAQIELTEKGKEFEQIIEQYVPEDEETKWRIDKIRSQLAKATGAGADNTTFDVLVLDGQEGQLDGELALDSFQIRYGSSLIPVSRDQIAAISDRPLEANFALSNSVGGGERQQQYPDANGTMPPGMNFIGFEQLPSGKEMRSNLDLSSAYAPRGVLFSTSFTDSYIGAQMYTFTDGRGGSYSIANVEPTYQGVMTISFCVPGNELFAAGTRYVGFNVSHVNPDGTFFEAYDAQGQLITRFTTDESGTDYLGYRSEVPIARVVVRPNPEVDEDFALDDLFFETPVALLESGNPEFFTVVSRKGERLQANEVSIEGNSLKLEKLSFGTGSISLAMDQAWVLIPPRSKLKKKSGEETQNHCYCLTRDGAIQLADLATRKSIRFRQPVEIEDLLAIWGVQNQLSTPPTYKIPKGSAALFADGQYFDLANVGLGKDWIQSPSIEELAPLLKDILPGPLQETRYVNSSCIYFGTPPQISTDTGVLYTYDGERYFIGEKFASLKINSSGIELSRMGNLVQMPWEEIKSLRLPSQSR
ncbi:MAG: hypothetical protein VX768_08485 [Planctomycetota bacterium]|nr:hypothetical protein [Planctomycetota bacterium]